MYPLKKNMLILRVAEGRESALIESYLEDGPTKLKLSLDLSDEQWEAIFEYLVFKHNLLFKAVNANSEFFIEKYISFGTVHVREILNATDQKFDEMWSVVFDFMAIANGALIEHVVEHRERYLDALWEHGSDFVRKVLGVFDDKYEENWAKVLDFLLHATCGDLFSERNMDEALKAYTALYNVQREQRPISESGLI
jgi:hypothetical protein